jgi:hypothetical protein
MLQHYDISEQDIASPGSPTGQHEDLDLTLRQVKAGLRPAKQDLGLRNPRAPTQPQD